MNIFKKNWLAAAPLLGLWLSMATSIAADAPGEKWISLFNGKDLTGWTKVHDVTVEVKDGNLRVVTGMGWLRLDKEYQDFVLEFECRALQEEYDSGVFIRSGSEGKPWPTNCFQLNLRYNALGQFVKNRKPIVPAETPKKPVNQWAKFRLEVKGNKARLNVDGEDAWETDLVDVPKGCIGIQIENKSFDFRNLRLREL